MGRTNDSPTNGHDLLAGTEKVGHVGKAGDGRWENSKALSPNTALLSNVSSYRLPINRGRQSIVDKIVI
jgi:hypothetical protein